MANFDLHKSTITKARFSAITDLLIAGEDLATLWLPGSGRTEFSTRLESRKEFAENFSTSQLQDYIFVFLNCSFAVEFLEKQLDLMLARHSTQVGIRAKLQDLIFRKRTIVFIMDNFSFSSIKLLEYIESLRQIDVDAIVFFSLALESDFAIYKQSVKEMMPIFHNNVLKVPYFNNEESHDWLELNAQSAQIKLVDSDYENIYAYCGGILSLLKMSLLLIKKYQAVEPALISQEMKLATGNLWQRFSTKERLILHSIAKGKLVEGYDLELSYFREHLLLNSNDQVIGNWIHTALGSTSEIRIEINQGRFIWERADITDLFSVPEYEVMHQLLNKAGQTVSNSDLASTDNVHVEDLPQLLMQLRKKLSDIGINEEVLESSPSGMKIKAVKIESNI